MDNNKKKKFESAKDILMSSIFSEQRQKAAKYVRHEFQDFGYRLALNLNDLKHKSLYFKLAKNEDRVLLQKALSYSMDYPKARNKGKIFMWKLKELRAERKQKEQEEADKNLKLGI